MLCRAHIQADALNRQALVSVVYIRELGIDGYCPKCILLLLTVLLPEIVCQIRSLLEDSWGTRERGVRKKGSVKTGGVQNGDVVIL